MQVSVEAMQGLERRMTIALPAEKIDSEVSSRLHKLRNTANLKGFRPGKVPAKLINSRYSEAVRYEVLEELMRSSLNEAFTQENIRPAGVPRVEPKQFETGKPFEYTAVFEVFPEINLIDLNGVEILKPVATVTESDVDTALERIRKMQATWEDVSRPAKMGDRVLVNFVAKVDGKPLPDGAAENYKLELGNSSMIPGFEDGLVGLSVGETKTLKLPFPEQYHNKEIAGKDAEFDVSLTKITEAKLPELDDSLAVALRIKDGTLAALRAEVLSNLNQELTKQLSVKLKQTVFDNLIELNPVILPKALVQAEIQQLKQNAIAQMRQPNLQADKLPNEPFVKEAERRVHIGLLVNRFCELNAFKVESSEIRQKVEEHVNIYEDSAEMVNLYLQNKNVIAEFQALILEEKVVAKLLENAIVKEQASSYSEIIETANKK